MRLPVVITKTHLGKSLELDCDQETITLLGPAGEALGTLSWEAMINQMLLQAPPSTPMETRSQARVALSFRVRYRTPEGEEFEGQAGGVSGGGLFIEKDVPLPTGTKLSMELLLPDAPADWLMAKGVVAWVCPMADQYTFSPGMGIQFTETTAEVRERVLGLVRSQRRSGVGSSSSR